MNVPAPAVSVVVPVYNPGPFLRPLLDCLDAQETVPDGVEAVLVDDGCTDGTGTLLDHWTATRTWARVIHQPGSGWPSRPRNVGRDAARGRYVFFVDQDDRLADDALRRMTAFADRTHADVILGRMAGARKVPRVLFRHTVADARPPETPLQDSMTTHVMFRRAFLQAQDLRFDEQARRMEDHLFMAAAYTASARTAVYADTDVYIHAARTDGGGAGYRVYDPAAYYHDLARAIGIVVDALPAGPERDAYLTRWTRIELVGRLRSDAVRWLPRDRRDAFFDGVRATLREAMPADIVQRVPAHWRWPTALATCATPDEFLRAEDVMTGSLRSALADTPGSVVLRGTVSASTLQAAVALLGGDPPLPAGRAAGSPRTVRARRARRSALQALTRVGAGRLHERLVAWGRTPIVFARQALAWATPAAALGAAAAVGRAPRTAVALGAVAAGGTAALAVQSTSGGPTALRLALNTAPLVAAAVRRRSPSGAVAVMTALALALLGWSADRRGRRHDVRVHADLTRRRLGRIAATATATATTVAVLTARSARRLGR